MHGVTMKFRGETSLSVRGCHVCCMRYIFVLNSMNVPFSCEYFVFPFFFPVKV